MMPSSRSIQEGKGEVIRDVQRNEVRLREGKERRKGKGKKRGRENGNRRREKERRKEKGKGKGKKKTGKREKNRKVFHTPISPNVSAMSMLEDSAFVFTSSHFTSSQISNLL